MADALLAAGIDVRKVFAPEHGFRGTADAGAKIKNGRDPGTNLPVLSLYGRTKKPSAEMLADVDVLVFDMQDVGTRFYTYISTLYYVMEAAAERGKRVLVLDRPNPNGHRIDGPVLDMKFTSFVGIAPIPVLHGLTVGEFARMVNGEGWLKGGLRAELDVLAMEGYTHATPYELPIAPSPNLPNMRSVYLYPHLCFFEGTSVSVGRGTQKQFQVYGHPAFTFGDYRFTPSPQPGATNPKLNGTACRGVDLTAMSAEAARDIPALDVDRLLKAYADLKAQNKVFFERPDFFDLLAGTDRLRLDIKAGKTAGEIRAGWAEELAVYRRMREGYVLYP